MLAHASNVLTIQCNHRGCNRSCFAVEQTPQGLAISITQKHDGQWHTSKYRYDLIKNILTEDEL